MSLLLFYYIYIYIFFHENYFYFFMFPDVPECSGMFHVPGFIDARFIDIKTKGDSFTRKLCLIS